MNGFLHLAGWADADRQALAGDASARRYLRLRQAGQSAILMIDPDGDVARFARLARHLRGLSLSAPEILAQDTAKGLLLIEDLGDGVLARLCQETPSREADLYRVAVDALLALHRHSPPEGLAVAEPALLARMTDLAFDWYCQDGALGARVAAALAPLLTRFAGKTDVMVLRDFHAENILFLPERTGAARAGLLDFQDALVGHRAYDLASLIRDARRDVSPATAEAAISYYVAQTGLDEPGFRAALAVLGVQRNLRILGVFARLAALYQKPGYLDLIPRVWRDLQRDLTHEALTPLRPILKALPTPSSDHLDKLRHQCRTP